VRSEEAEAGGVAVPVDAEDGEVGVA